MTPATDFAVRKSVTVRASAERAFRVFTEGIDTWWPRSHHIGKSPMKRNILETHAGGRCYSQQEDGSECDWGSVLQWDPPRRFVMAWQVAPNWQFEPDLAKSSEVEVTFTALGRRVDAGRSGASLLRASRCGMGVDEGRRRRRRRLGRHAEPVRSQSGGASMSATRLYRIAAVLFVLFAAAHTFGFLRFKPPTEEGMAVLNAMNTVHFAGFSYGGFYVGFGLYVSVYMIFSAFLAWHLSNVATLYPQSIGALGWIFFGIQIASLVLSWKYFSSGPAMFSAMVALFLGWAAAKTGSRVST